MTRGIFPPTDNGLLAWSLTFKDRIVSAPEAYGLTAAQAADYAALHDAFAAAMMLVVPEIRNRVAVTSKNAAREALKDRARKLASIVRGQHDVTDAQKIGLGLALRAKPTAIPRPSGAPGISIETVRASTVTIRLYDIETGGRRGKPPGAMGASLFIYVGQVPPETTADWRFYGNVGRMKVDVTFPGGLAPGDKVWLTATWFNGRKQAGPMANPISTNVLGGDLHLGLRLAA